MKTTHFIKNFLISKAEGDNLRVKINKKIQCKMN